MMRHINLLFAMEATDGRHVGVISNNGLIWGDKNEWGSTICEPHFIHGDQAVASGMRYCLLEADSLMSTRHTWPNDAAHMACRANFLGAMHLYLLQNKC